MVRKQAERDCMQISLLIPQILRRILKLVFVSASVVSCLRQKECVWLFLWFCLFVVVCGCGLLLCGSCVSLSLSVAGLFLTFTPYPSTNRSVSGQINTPPGC
jgi:hypothetical protein